MKAPTLALCAFFWATAGVAAAAERPRLLVLDFELVDTSSEPIDHRAEHARRLVVVHDYIASALAARELFELADSAPVRAKIDSILVHQYLRSCNGCEFALAHDASADLVMLVQFNKISTLIGSMDVLIKDAKTENAVYHQVFGFRGDTDEAWMRAAKYFVESFYEKQSADKRRPQ
jgi:hypothetical protein